MDLELKQAVENLETINPSKLEDLKDKCGRQIIMWVTTDPKKLTENRQQVKWCETLVNFFGNGFLENLEKE